MPKEIGISPAVAPCAVDEYAEFVVARNVVVVYREDAKGIDELELASNCTESPKLHLQ